VGLLAFDVAAISMLRRGFSILIFLIFFATFCPDAHL
jgi:hypothetical protein